MAVSVKRIVGETTFVMLISATVSIFAGLFLQVEVERLLTFPFLLSLIPPINDMGGNIGSMLGARLSSALHLGLIRPKIERQRVLDENMAESIGSGLFSFFAAGAVLLVWGMIRGMVSPLRFFLTFIVAGVILTPIIVVCTVFITVISYVKRLDPDNVVGPLITSIADVLGVLVLLLVSKLLWG
jgi:mgtE-like transporter